MFAWLFDLNPKERGAFAACAGGWALDAMDVQIYSFVIPALIATWGISRGQAGDAFSDECRAPELVPGGWFAGWFADRFEARVRTLQIAILWFAGFTFLSGLAQSFEQLFVARAIMGFGFGGEWAAGAVLLGETIRAEHRGKALGLMQAGWAVGWGAAALLYALFFSHGGLRRRSGIARLLFLIYGIAPALLVFFVRRYVVDAPVYLESKAKLALNNEKPSFLEIFRPPLLTVTFLGGLMGTGAQGSCVAPSPPGCRHFFARSESFRFWIPWVTWRSRSSARFAGIWREGCWRTGLGGGSRSWSSPSAAGAVAVVYTTVAFGNAAMLVLGFPLGFFSAGVFSAMGPFFTEHFPTRVRGIGQGFAYNIGRATGALFPALVGFLSAQMPLGHAIGLFAGVGYATMAVAAFLLPETRGKVLEA